MNDFLESFLLFFGENKYTNLKRYWTTSCYKTKITVTKKKVVKITILVTMAIKL